MGQPARLKCITGDGESNVTDWLPTLQDALSLCSAGQRIDMMQTSPECWDGKNLDAVDHRSHMMFLLHDRNTGQQYCKGTHPHLIRRLNFQRIFTIRADDVTTSWRLSSDMPARHARIHGARRLHYCLERQGARSCLERQGARALDDRLHQPAAHNCSPGNIGDGSKMTANRLYDNAMAAKARRVSVPKAGRSSQCSKVGYCHMPRVQLNTGYLLARDSAGCVRWGMRRLAPVFPFLALCFLLAEIAARATIDIKLYGADAEIGYWVLPDQSGGSLLVGSYAINPQGFGVSEPFQTTSRNDVLLIGDSLVFGTSKLDQHERLGPVLERLTGWEVWPLSAGSWTLANQLRMLKRVPLDGVEAIVFILNAEDFGPPSHWRNEYDSPRGEPRFYLPYAMRKIIPQLRQSDEPIPIRRGDLRAEWKRFRTRTQVPAIVVGYESAKTTGNQCEWLPNWLDVTTLCFDPVERREHSNMLDSVHLNAKGNESFARFLAARDLLQVERTTE